MRLENLHSDVLPSAHVEAQILQHLLRHTDRSSKLDYITFYRDQKELFKRTMPNWEWLAGVHTVDASQGLDNQNGVLLSIGRPYGIGFLSDIRRLTVSLSRSQQYTIMVVHSDVVNTGHPVGCVFQALREIALKSGAHVVYDNERSMHTVLDHVQNTIHNSLNVSAAEVVSQSLLQRAYASKRSLKEEVISYMQECMSRLEEEAVPDIQEEMNPEDIPEQHSDSSESCLEEQLTYSPRIPPSPPPRPPKKRPSKPTSSRSASPQPRPPSSPPPPSYPPPPSPEDWVVLRINNVHAIPAKFEYDLDKWQDLENATARMGASLAHWFGWSTEQHAWFRESAGVLWKIIPGYEPKGGATFKDYLTRKAKIYGMLPVKLFPELRFSVDGKAPIERLFTKRQAMQTSYSANVPAGFDWYSKPLVFKTDLRGTEKAAQTHVEEPSKFKPLADGCHPLMRRDAVESWSLV